MHRPRRGAPPAWVAAVLAAAMLRPAVALAEDGGATPLHVAPRVVPRSSSEYYSPSPSAKVAVAVDIWGEVREPGAYYLAVGSTVARALTLAGGPTGDAALPEVTLLRDGETRSIDLYREGQSVVVKERDTIFVDHSIRRDLPLIIGGISVTVSVATLILLVGQRRQ